MSALVLLPTAICAAVALLVPDGLLHTFAVGGIVGGLMVVAFAMERRP